MTITDTLVKLDPGTGETLTQTRFGSTKIDLPTEYAGLDIAAGEPVTVHAAVKTAVTGATASATVEIQAVTTHLAVPASTTATVTIAVTTGIVTHTAHGYPTGMPVVFSGGGGATEIVRGTTYYVIKINADTYNVALSLANALAGTAIGTAAASTGTVTVVSVPTGETALITAATDDKITLAGHGLATGTPVQINIGGATLTGVTTNLIYYVARIQDNDNAFYLTTTPANAVLTAYDPTSNPPVDITAVTDTNGVLTLHVPANVVGTSGPLYRDMLAAGSIVTFPMFQRMEMSCSSGSPIVIPRPAGRSLWCRFVPSTAVTAGKFQVELTTGYHGGRHDHYQTGRIVR